MPLRFVGKGVFITGAGRGIGLGIAIAFAREGASVVLCDCNAENLQSAAVEVEGATMALPTDNRGTVHRVVADVSSGEAVQSAFETARQNLGRIDLVVANAAYSDREPVLSASWVGVEKTVGVTQFGVYHTCKAAAEHMASQSVPDPPASRGRIVVISSIMSLWAIPGSSAYAMSKAAINSFTATLAQELAQHRINVNTVLPGHIDTPGERKFLDEDGMKASAQRIPWGRLGRPDDVAKAVLFLCSDDAEYITGSSLLVDGGLVNAVASGTGQPAEPAPTLAPMT